jgi:hypothetical protein
LKKSTGEAGNFTVNLAPEPPLCGNGQMYGLRRVRQGLPHRGAQPVRHEFTGTQAAFKLYPQGMPSAFAIDKRGTAPCKATCPAHVSIQGYIALINDGRYKEALKLFKDDHPFPAVCGRVCHHPCESECTRNDVDQPLAIRNCTAFWPIMKNRAVSSTSPKSGRKTG